MFWPCADLFKIKVFDTFFDEYPHSALIRPGIMSGFILVQTVIKCYQPTTNMFSVSPLKRQEKCI